MIKDLYQNRVHYLVLFLGLGMGLILLFSLPDYKKEAVIGLCSFYFLWGVFHHWRASDLHIKIVLEYLLVALIGCIILLSVILQGGQL